MMLQKVQQLLPRSRLFPFDVALCTTIEPYTGHFATNGLEMLHKLQHQQVKWPLRVGIVAENTTMVTTDAHFRVLIAD
ncbi:hypothetical protein ASG85_28910 [Paenibacillus sp. Soil724D2]|nr:hypothetical protein ASG85_28910 [Paenibacillus sp. Soil724D2]